MDAVETKTIQIGTVRLSADLIVPPGARGVIVFAHGSGSSRLSPRNREVAAALREGGIFGTLLFDLLTAEEDLAYRNRFEIGLLTERLVAAARWVSGQPEAADLPLGLFGASTGAAAALNAEVELASMVRAIVSRGGRPDLAGPTLIA
jgi:pimeloyl-ACP methyl ester carboxylesterase